MKPVSRASVKQVAAIAFLLCLLAGCSQASLSRQETATLRSLRQVDDWPLYVMHYQGAYEQASGIVARSGDRPQRWEDLAVAGLQTVPPDWACSLFAALGDPSQALYGRNFDWQHSPALLLFTDPPDAYASVSMVDVAYLGYKGNRAQGLDDLPLEELRPLLQAPHLPFDGLNERGLAVGMAAVPPGDMAVDPAKETRGSLAVMREMLDHAANVDEALAILERYNISFGGGPPLHYLLADRSGRALLVEYHGGQRVVHPNEEPWHLATNFILASVRTPQGNCRRYDALDRRLAETQGRLAPEGAMDALASVAQESTQWSVTYGLATGEVRVVMGRGFDEVHTFELGIGAGPP